MDEKFIKAQQAVDFLASDVWKRAYERARQSLHSQWEASADTETRERIWYTIKALDMVKTAIVSEASHIAVETAKAK